MKKLLAIAAGVMVLTSGAALGDPAPRSTGGVTSEFINPNTNSVNTIKFDFNAHAPGKGRANWRNETTGAWFKGDVTCYRADPSNVAYFFGVVTEASNPAFQYFVARVEDNGEPGDGDIFRVSPGAMRDCETFVFNPGDTWPVTAGNLVVHH